MIRLKYTKSATFIFPLLNIKKEIFKFETKSFGFTTQEDRFINAYMQDEIVESFEKNHLFLLVKNYRDIDFEDFNLILTSYPNYVDNYENNDFMVYIFSIPEENLQDYTLILKGKYSEISENGQKLIRKNAYCNNDYHLLPLIFNKMPKLKAYWEERLSNPGSEAKLGDAEVWPIINQEEQILRINTIKIISKKSKLIPSGEFA
jgi:hypothetical protein